MTCDAERIRLQQIEAWCCCSGTGNELLSTAEDIAASLAKRGMSIIVADTNTGARRLYERRGYVEVAQRAMVKDDWQHPGTNWVLLAKDL